MRFRLFAVPLVAAALAGGCGGDPALNSAGVALTKGVKGPKGGTAIPLVEGEVYAEPIVETIGPAKAKNSKTAFVVYLVKADGSPPSELPAFLSATFTVPAASEPMTVTLSPKAVEKAPPGRFATEPGNFAHDEFTGEIKATLGGREVAAPFALR